MRTDWWHGWWSWRPNMDVMVPKGHGDVNRGRMESEPQTSGAVMEARRVKGAFKAAETKEAVAP